MNPKEHLNGDGRGIEQTEQREVGLGWGGVNSLSSLPLSPDLLHLTVRNQMVKRLHLDGPGQQDGKV